MLPGRFPHSPNLLNFLLARHDFFSIRAYANLHSWHLHVFLHANHFSISKFISFFDEKELARFCFFSATIRKLCRFRACYSSVSAFNSHTPLVGVLILVPTARLRDWGQRFGAGQCGPLEGSCLNRSYSPLLQGLEAGSAQTVCCSQKKEKPCAQIPRFQEADVSRDLGVLQIWGECHLFPCSPVLGVVLLKSAFVNW